MSDEKKPVVVYCDFDRSHPELPTMKCRNCPRVVRFKKGKYDAVCGASIGGSVMSLSATVQPARPIPLPLALQAAIESAKAVAADPKKPGCKTCGQPSVARLITNRPLKLGCGGCGKISPERKAQIQAAVQSRMAAKRGPAPNNKKNG